MKSLLLPTLLLLVTLMPAQDQSLPFAVRNPRHKKFPPDLAQRIFDAVIASASLDLKVPAHASLILELGVAGRPVVRLTDGVTLIQMDEWDESAFAYGVGCAVNFGLLKPKDTVADWGKRGLRYASATISVKDLQTH